ncbi:MAG TPA: carbohydrate ABC transporter permease [Chthonomonadaceae bacterium]|nr:carbohydrate ABC transporter permease [Chthonomonadaceae bacterium]
MAQSVSGLRRSGGQALLLAALVGLLGLSLVPFGMMVVMSLKSNAQIFAHFWELPHPARWDFYARAYSALVGYILNTLIVAAATVLGVLVLSSMAGYTFARHRFPGREGLYYLILALLMIPGVLTLIPTYALVKAIQLPALHIGAWTFGPFALLNTRWALILPYISGGQVFGILLCRSFFQSLPEELFEAARLDGAAELDVYRRIALPLSRPILATVAIMTVLSVYNDYIWPLVALSDSSLQTFSVGVTKFAGEFNLDYGPTLAGYVLGSLPLLLLFALGMRQFIQGITAGALKA